jgi:hypothetical protein
MRSARRERRGTPDLLAGIITSTCSFVRSGLGSKRRIVPQGGGGNRSREGRSRPSSGPEASLRFPSENGVPICPGESRRVRPEVPAGAAGLPWWPPPGPSLACRALAPPLEITRRACPACLLSACHLRRAPGGVDCDCWAVPGGVLLAAPQHPRLDLMPKYPLPSVSGPPKLQKRPVLHLLRSPVRRPWLPPSDSAAGRPPPCLSSSSCVT